MNVSIKIPIIFLFSVHLKKIADDECPLFLRLCAGPNEKVLSLVLKENETGEVNVSKCRRLYVVIKVIFIRNNKNVKI